MNELKPLMNKLNIEEVEEKAKQLEQYMEGVLAWNEKVNLTAITEREEFVQKHLIDSLLCAETLGFTEASSICDVGTGGGFPGVPLAVCYPEKEFVLMDTLGKRVRIVQQLCDDLGITNVLICASPEQWRICACSASTACRLSEQAGFLSHTKARIVNRK